MPHLIPAAGMARSPRLSGAIAIARRPRWTEEVRQTLTTSGLAPREIVAEVARAHDLAPADLMGPDARKHVVLARTRALRTIAEAYPHLSLTDLCAFIGRRRSTALGRVVASARPVEAALRPGEAAMASDVARIISQTARAFGTTSQAIVGNSRLPEVLNARLHAMHAVRKAKPLYSLTQIARPFRRHHTTVLSNLQKMERDGVPQPPASAGESVGGA